jgi:hypothetical protein
MPAYEGIRTVEPFHGPFALWAGQRFSNGTLTAQLTLHSATEYAALLFRASSNGDNQRGYDVLFDAREQRIALRRIGTNTATLATVQTPFALGKPLRVTVDATNGQLRLWLNAPMSEVPMIKIVDPSPIIAGQAGVSAWGAPLTVRQLDIAASNAHASAVPADCNASQRAMESWCLLMLNLNEVAYVD